MNGILKKSIMIILCLGILLNAAPGAYAAADFQTLYYMLVSDDFTAKTVRNRDFEEAYDTVADMTAREDYDGDYIDASNTGVFQASFYVAYLEAWKLEQDGDMEGAYNRLRSISNQGFFDTDGYLTYLMGRIEQNKGNYALALDRYAEAASAGFSVNARLREECGKLSDASVEGERAQGYALGEDYWNKGLYKAAADAFAALGYYKDADTRRQKCLYAYASTLIESEEYQDAMDTFISLKGYQDSVAMAAKCFQLLYPDSRPIVTISDPTQTLKAADRMEIAWDDTVPAGKYIVTYYPGRADDMKQELVVTEQRALLSGLLPAMAYSVSVSKADNPDLQITEMFSTKQADYLDEDKYEVKHSEICEVRLSRLEKNGVEKAYAARDAKHELTNLSLPNETLGEGMTGYVLVESLKFAQIPGDETYNFGFILRIGAYRAFSQQTVSFAQLGSKYAAVYQNLTPMLDEIYDAAGAWPDTAARLDFYMDGCFAERVSIALNTENSEQAK